jgi:hypothetical protein
VTTHVAGSLQHEMLLRRPGRPVACWQKPGPRISGAPFHVAPHPGNAERLGNTATSAILPRKVNPMASRPVKRLQKAVALLLLAGVLVFLFYDLYAAWTYRMVFLGLHEGRLIGMPEWVTLDAHPNVFWWRLTEDCVALALIGGGLLIAARWKAMKPRRIPRPANR